MSEEDTYIPDQDDWKDWEELVEEQKQWNKKTYTLVINHHPRQLSREKFIAFLRRVIVKNIPEYTTKTRAELISYLEEQFHVRDELRRYCDLSESDFNKMLDGATFPYLESAWNSMFHPGILQDMDEDKRIFREPKPVIRPEIFKPVERPKKKEPQSKTVKKVKKEKIPSQKKVEKPKQRGLKSSYAWKISDELLNRDYSLQSFLKQLSKEMMFDKYKSRSINNTIRVLLFIQKLQILYADKPITLTEFIKMCIGDKVSTTKLDAMVGTNRLFSNIINGATKGLHQKEDLKILFRKAFHIELSC